jgi:hypothetical protein
MAAAVSTTSTADVTTAVAVAVTAAVTTASTAAATVAAAALALTSVVVSVVVAAVTAPRRKRLAMDVRDGGRSTLFARSGVRRIGWWIEPMLLTIAYTHMVAAAVVEVGGSGEEHAP